MKFNAHAKFGDISQWAWACLPLLACLVCADVLFSSDRILGSVGTDVAQQFIAWRSFGFGAMLQGSIPLWNPHVYSGAPYFGGMQAALAYPLNWPLFLLLDVRSAINACFVLHLALLGTFTYAWLRGKGHSPGAATVGGAIAMLGGTTLLHVSAGHLTNLCAMAWMPAMLFAIDRGGDAMGQENVAKRRRLLVRAMVLGAGVGCMQVLAGHPQYVYIGAIAGGVYAVAKGGGAGRAGWMSLWLTAVALLGLGLAAVQLLPGLVANSETVRSRALDYDFAAMFSFPLENVMTVMAPDIWGAGRGAEQIYWGRWYLWECSLFVGSGALLLAGCGFCASAEDRRRDRGALLAMALACGWIALGDATPLYGFLYQWVPGFDRFRGVSKFVFPVSLAMAALAAMGIDNSHAWNVRRMTWAVAGAGIILILLAALASQFGGYWVITNWQETHQSYALERLAQAGVNVSEGLVPAKVGSQMAQALSSAALWVFVLLGFLTLASHYAFWGRQLPLAVGLLALAQLTAFARGHLESMPYGDPSQPWRAVIGPAPKDSRISNPFNSNSAMLYGAFEVAGNDPGVATRYAEFMAYLEGRPPERANQYIQLSTSHPLHRLLRLRQVVRANEDGVPVVLDVRDPPLSRFNLIGRYRIQTQRETVLQAMSADDFEPASELVLEREPNPRPQDHPVGSVEVQSCGTDVCVVRVQTDRPALLLMTDAWAASWRVEPESAGPQANYDLVPANWAFRAVALAEGVHHLRIFYDRRPLRWGGAISALMVVLCALLWLGAGRFVPGDGKS